VAAAQSRDGRVARAVVDAAVLAAVVPTGVALVTRNDPGLEAFGVTLLLGGWYDLFDLASTPFAGPMETLHNRYEARLASGRSTLEATAETEAEWRAAIRHIHDPLWFALRMGMGAAEAGAGLYLLLANPTATNVGREAQTTWGIIAVGASLPLISNAICSLFGSSEMENFWGIYQSVEPPVAPTGPAALLSRATVAFAPVPQGAAGFVRLTF
jgi:hypothetical protein